MNEYQKLPQIGKITQILPYPNKKLLSQIASKVIQNERENIANGATASSEDEIIKKITQEYEKSQKKPKKLINATGVILHTNLGRAPLSEKIYELAKENICGYSDLEFDTQTGRRGDRYAYVKSLFQSLSGCDDALVVNNNAAAVFLVLNTLAKNFKSIVSRGELVEIGGSFRVPEVMKEAGTELVEVGTTNRTNLQDYKDAITEDTRLILKVHRSNFDIVGFSQSVDIKSIANLAKEHGIISYYDLGSGYASRLPEHLEKDEPSVQELLLSGVNLLSFSGDKLFGSVQCGIILGDKALIDKLRKNQLLRMLRVDKITLNLLALSLEAYLEKDYKALPALEFLHRKDKELIAMANKINEGLLQKLKLRRTSTYAGGGSLPNKAIKTIALALQGDAERLQDKFRTLGVIGRIENGEFLLDLKAVSHKEIDELIMAINLIQKEEK
ncbi:L-seryl-tRNA(Sec) selenium transferase [Campylobacter sp. 19-13652]|uniref:L-seryl-tRNA(Sec) selenium transferase n=1 Tax=Campylobacter sp. 19-13652 TaxID=2840180 RepID=UPI001C7602DE|nr:L-seryl-tRNA(Sec) selenium transferase [Campylobacter sp. 19-13652]BCX78891.1 L-seryl-tRNA(Sec) selenium transferase [Campylobacter sp. 19-13652]